jgi:hypothetical protein
MGNRKISIVLNKGDIYGKMEVIGEAPRRKGARMVEVKCLICGEVSIVYFSTLRGEPVSCKYCRPSERLKYKAEDIIGKKYHRLTVLEVYNKKDMYGRSNRYVKCRCDCGNEHHALLHAVVSGKGNIKSCGCLQKDATKNHFVKTKKYVGISVVEQNKKIGLICSACECFYNEENGYPVICKSCTRFLKVSNPSSMMLKYKKAIKKEL